MRDARDLLRFRHSHALPPSFPRKRESRRPPKPVIRNQTRIEANASLLMRFRRHSREGGNPDANQIRRSEIKPELNQRIHSPCTPAVIPAKAGIQKTAKAGHTKSNPN